MKLWSKVLQMFLFSLYFSSLNLKYLKLTKMELSRFAMKLFKCVYVCVVVGGGGGGLSVCIKKDI